MLTLMQFIYLVRCPQFDLYTFVFLYRVLCNFIMCVSPLSQSTYWTFPSSERSLVLPLCGHIPFFLLPSRTPSLTSDNHWSVLHFCHFVISWMLSKWNHTVCRLLGTGFFSLSKIIWITFQIIVCIKSSFYCWEILYGMDVLYLICWMASGLFPVLGCYEHE